MSEETKNNQELRALTAEIVGAYVGNNSVHLGDLPAVIASVHGALGRLKQPTIEPATERPTPPVPIRRTITPDYLISLEDGQQYKSLKRHLTGKGLTPQQYREKWGLKPDYPMTAPAYSAKRSELARSLGLGRKKGEPAPIKRGGRRKAA